MPLQQQPQKINQQQLDNSIAQMRQAMIAIQNSSNQEQALANYIYNNPNSAALAQMLSSGNNLESIARNMAQQYGIDINTVINKLMGQ